eukprot:Nk52_evm30s151 gene=Nk52_evmTU30s151
MEGEGVRASESVTWGRRGQEEEGGERCVFGEELQRMVEGLGCSVEGGEEGLVEEMERLVHGEVVGVVCEAKRVAWRRRKGRRGKKRRSKKKEEEEARGGGEQEVVDVEGDHEVVVESFGCSPACSVGTVTNPSTVESFASSGAGSDGAISSSVMSGSLVSLASDGSTASKLPWLKPPRTNTPASGERGKGGGEEEGEEEEEEEGRDNTGGGGEVQVQGSSDSGIQGVCIGIGDVVEALRRDVYKQTRRRQEDLNNWPGAVPGSGYWGGGGGGDEKQKEGEEEGSEEEGLQYNPMQDLSHIPEGSSNAALYGHLFERKAISDVLEGVVGVWGDKCSGGKEESSKAMPLRLENVDVSGLVEACVGPTCGYYNDVELKLRAHRRVEDELTRNMSTEEYMKFSEKKKASFTFRKTAKFIDWLMASPVLSMHFGNPFGGGKKVDVVEVLGFVTFLVLTEIIEKVKAIAQRRIEKTPQKRGKASSIVNVPLRLEDLHKCLRMGDNRRTWTNLFGQGDAQMTLCSRNKRLRFTAI